MHMQELRGLRDGRVVCRCEGQRTRKKRGGKWEGGWSVGS